MRRDLHRGPQAGDPGQDRGVDAEVQDVLRVRGVERRHVQVRECQLGRARHGGGLGARIVADQHHRAAVRIGAYQVGVPQRVGGTVQAGRLAVPVPHDPLEGGTAGVGGGAQGARAPGELGPHHRRGARLLVEGGAVHDVERPEELATPGQFEVVPRERRSLVTADQARGEQILPAVEPCPVADRPDQCLDPGEEDRAALARVAIGEGERSGVRLPGPRQVVMRAVRGVEERGHDQHLAFARRTMSPQARTNCEARHAASPRSNSLHIWGPVCAS